MNGSTRQSCLKKNHRPIAKEKLDSCALLLLYKGKAKVRTLLRRIE